MMDQQKAQFPILRNFDEALSTSASEDEETFGPSGAAGNNYTATWGPWGPEDEEDNVRSPWPSQELLWTPAMAETNSISPPSPRSPKRWADIVPSDPADQWDGSANQRPAAQAEPISSVSNTDGIVMVPCMWVMGMPQIVNYQAPPQHVLISSVNPSPVTTMTTPRHVKGGVERMHPVQVNAFSGKTQQISSKDHAVLPIPCDEGTTVMMRHLPRDFTRDGFLEVLDSEGFSGAYNFIYLPMDFQNHLSFGYLFVNFVSHKEANRSLIHFDSYLLLHEDKEITMEARWSGPQQGLAAHIERFRNSPVMHAGVADKYKPAVFSQGERIEFPAPTKRIRKPRLRHHSHVGEETGGFDGQ